MPTIDDFNPDFDVQNFMTLAAQRDQAMRQQPQSWAAQRGIGMLSRAAASAPASSTPVASGIASGIDNGPQPGNAAPSYEAAAISRPGSIAAISPGLSNDLYQARSAAVQRGESFKDGGMVRGRGTGTSDSNRINVSHGEAVLPADTVHAVGGESAINDLIRRTHKPVAAKKKKGYVNGGVVRRIDEFNPDYDTQAMLDAAKKRKRGIADLSSGNMMDEAALSQPVTAPGKGSAAMLDLATPRVMVPTAPQPMGIAAQVTPRSNLPTLPDPSSVMEAGYPAVNMGLNRGTMPNATGGQAQARAVDNAIEANRQIGPAATAITNYAAPNNPGGGWEGRNAIRGGAAPSTLDQGSGVTGTRGNFVSQGIGGTPGTQIQSDYGYGDTITATADKNGKFNSFSGIGGTGNQSVKPGIADLSAGLARAAANREQLANIEAERNAINTEVPAAAPGQRGDTRGVVPGRGDPRLGGIASGIADPRQSIDAANANASNARTRAEARSISSGIVDAAAIAPYRQASTAAGIDQTRAQTGRVAAMTPGEVESQGIHTAISKLDLKGKQRLDEIGTKIAAATDPKDIERYGNQYLAATGHAKPEDYVVSHAAGRKTMDGSEPDNIVVTNKRTGKSELVQVGATQPQIPEGQRGTINGVRGTIKNGKFIPD